MIIQKLLPGVLKEILTHVPTILFKVIKWDEIAKEIPILTKRILQKEGYDHLVLNLKNHLSKSKIKFTDSLGSNREKIHPKEMGNQLLDLYFSQLFSPDGLFLDLREQHFEFKNNELRWLPSSLWVKFSENFRQGLLEVYSGFYLQDDELYLSGLEKIGMLNKKWGEEDQNHLAHLFKSHFGNALDEEMNFNLDHFRDSIFKVSHFMLEKKVHISKDFLYLGIYLVTLYDHLEKTNCSHPVRAIFLKTKESYSDL